MDPEGEWYLSKPYLRRFRDRRDEVGECGDRGKGCYRRPGREYNEVWQWQGEEEGRDKRKDVQMTDSTWLTGQLKWMEGLSHRGLQGFELGSEENSKAFKSKGGEEDAFTIKQVRKQGVEV